MFDIGFSELVVIGVIALIVIGPERLPKVARTAGHLYGRMQRYVSAIRRAGQSFKDSVESAASGVEQQATVVDDYLRNEISGVTQAVTEGVAGEEPPSAKEQPTVKQTETDRSLQQSLPLDEPDQNHGRAPSAVVETAQSDSAGKPA